MNFKSKNIILTGVSVILFILGFIINDPFLWFESNYQKAKPLLKGFSADSVKKITVQAQQGQSASQEAKIFVRTADGWAVEVPTKNLSYKAESKKIEDALKNLFDARRYQAVTSTKEKYAEYDVNDQAAKVSLEGEGGRNLAQVQLGKQGSSGNTSFVRLSNEDEVYAVKGFLRNEWNQDVNSYRDRYILKFIKDNVKSVQYKAPNAFSLQRDDKGKWMLDPIRTADKKKIESVLNEISETTGNRFFDQPVLPAIFANLQITFSNNTSKSIEVRGPLKDNEFIIKSDDNQSWMVISKAKADSFFPKAEEFQEKTAVIPGAK